MKKNNIFYQSFISLWLYPAKAYLKGEGHLKVKVKVTQ